MSGSCKSWIDRLQFSTLFWPPPQDVQQRQAQVMAYVEYFGQFTLERFPEDISELIQKHYPNKEFCLLDDVLATFVLHHPEHGHAVVHPILSCIIEGTLLYDKSNPPFSSFISLFSPSSEKGYSEQWALACGEVLRVLTHYNRPIYKVDHQNSETDRSTSGSHATTSKCGENDGCHPFEETEQKPLRPLSPWITDVLLAAPLGIRSDYFRWCGGVMGKYAAGGELKPPTACGRGSGKHPQLMPSTPRWAVANGAGVLLSVCDEEVARYETANLTAAAVPALLLPPPSLDEHLVAGLPALEPYARLFHCYYAIATPSATQSLLLGLLEAPPSWAPDALDAAVQLVELLRTAEDYADGMRLPRNWMHLHFLQAIGTAMSTRQGIAADAAAALLFRVLSQPTLLFPHLNHVEATIEATAQGIASLLYAHGPEVERRICTIWEAAYGLLCLSSSTVDLPEIVVATRLQPPVLSWNLYLPLLKVLEYLPQGSPSEACLMRIFVATVKAILQRTFPLQSSREQTRWSRHLHGGIGSNSLAVTELHTMVNSLFLETPSEDLASRLLFVVLTVCISHEAVPKRSKGPAGADIPSPDEIAQLIINGKHREVKSIKSKTQCPVAVFDSYVLAAVCALACELQMFPSLAQTAKNPDSKDSLSNVVKINGHSHELRNGIYPAVSHICRILGILETLFLLKPSTVGTLRSYSSNEIVAAAMVAGHISELFGRSKACMHALSVLMRCKWDNKIYTRASSLYHLIDTHGKTVASMIDRAEPLEANAPLRKKATRLLGGKRQIKSPTDFSFGSEESSCLRSIDNNESEIFLGRETTLLLTDVMLSTSGKSIASLPVNASDLAIFFTMDRNIGFNYQYLLRSMLSENQEICVSVVSLLWHKLIASPEIQISVESTSAQQGWRQVVDALCNVVMASATELSMAVVLQAERHLHRWISRDDEQGQKMWRINQRIVNLIVELMRNCDTPESLLILASASDLLLCATDGILIDREACTLPRLELLEARARAVQLVPDWGESGLTITDGLSNLLKCRLPAMIHCLSHPSAHVRALSASLLRDILHVGSPKSNFIQAEDMQDNHVPPLQCSSQGIINWHAVIEKCLAWEAHRRRATGLTLTFLVATAKELGCAVPL